MYEEIIEDMRGRISPKRFAHILGVARAAMALADRYGEPVEHAYVAGLLHDCAKELPLSTIQQLVDEAGIRVDRELYRNGALLHGVAGAVMATDRYGVTDPDILEAIRVHTTGKLSMSQLDKIIFLADYIEETRDFPGVDELRRLAFQDLDRAVLAGYDNTIRHLLDQGIPIYFKTILGRNDMVRQIARNRKNA